MNRRSFIKGAAASGIAVGAGAAYLGLRDSSRLPDPRRPLSVLDRTSFGILAVFAGRILPFDGADPIEVAHGVDQSLRFATPEAQSDLRLVIGVLENALSGLLTRGSATLFSELDARSQDEAIRRWGRHELAPLRGATNALRKLCLGNYYAELDAAKSTGYPGPPLDKPTPPPIQVRGPLSRPWVASVVTSPAEVSR